MSEDGDSLRFRGTGKEEGHEIDRDDKVDDRLQTRVHGDEKEQQHTELLISRCRGEGGQHGEVGSRCPDDIPVRSDKEIVEDLEKAPRDSSENVDSHHLSRSCDSEQVSPDEEENQHVEEEMNHPAVGELVGEGGPEIETGEGFHGEPEEVGESKSRDQVDQVDRDIDRQQPRDHVPGGRDSKSAGSALLSHVIAVVDAHGSWWSELPEQFIKKENLII